MTGSALSPRLAVVGRGCRRRFVLLPNSRVSAHQGSRAHAAGRPTRFAATCRSPAGRSSARARQAGSSRIPTFGSRIPKAGAASSGAPPQLPTPTALPQPPVQNAPTARHLGRRVRVGDKDAVLRFLGPAHFAKGTWCGVELSSPSGKHDGTVCGVRYFACQPLYGLMVPLSKVSVPFDPPDDVSGPYSMLFLADNDTESSNQDSDDGNCDLNATIVKQDGPIPNRTLVINETITKPNFDVTKEAQEGQNITYKKPLNLTLIRSETITKPSNATFDISSPDSPVDNLTYNKERRYTFDLKPFEEKIQQESSVSKKRVNETFNTVENNNASSLDITKKNLTFLPINKSCEDLLNESSIEVKRRRTSNPKSHKIEPLILKQLDKTDSFDSPQQFTNGKLSSSTPMRAEFSDDLFRKLRLSNINSEANIFNVDDESNKRDSLDFEESLGILTPDQMIDFVPSRSPSVEYAVKFFNKTDVIPSSQLTSPREIIKIEETVLNIDTTLKSNKTTKDDELPSPNVNSITDYSLGIIDDRMLSECLFKTDTTMNMELPLDSKKDFSMIRCDQTPSPEELPLDTTPVVETSEPKTEPSKSTKTTSSFVTSITSITSLDTGYQGDGEMSRPASRGADNSPLTKRPIPRQQLRRPDPMTDSDFYTESDADNHEENHVRGDRKAQVIDGTLYGVDPQAAADIYVNNRENMDSSGVFTDIENNLRNEEEEIVSPNRTIDVSPSDSSKTISENSQSNLQEVLDRTMKKTEKENQNTPIKENSKKRNAPSPGISSPSSISSPRHNNKDESLAKKYKMPKRDVASKVKAMLEPVQNNVEKKTTLKKPVGRWDAVMNKISKNDQNKTNLKEVKSKVFNNVNLGNTGQRTASEGVRKTNVRQTNSPNNKVRRVRTRTLNKSGGNVESSINSSLSDLSAAAILPKKTPGSAKKRESIQVTQVLTPNKLPNNKNQQNLTETKKNATNQNASSSTNEPKFKRTIFSPKEKKQTTNNKECGKGAVKGGRTSPITTTGRTAVGAPQKTVPPPKVPRVPAPRTAEALAVLIQHLVFNVEAYQVPTLKRETQKLRLEADEIKQAYQQLEKRLVDERAVQVRQIENERERFREEVEDLIGKHREEITQITAQHVQIERQLRAEKENAHQYLCSQHEEQLSTLKKEFEKLQRTHEEALDILREENDSIREQIDEKRMEAETANHESVKLKKDYESREVKLKEQIDVLSAKNQRLKEQIGKSEGDFEDRVKALIDENKRLRDENDRLLSYGDDKEIGMQEVQSLRAVLELKQKEVGELRKTLAEATQKLELLVGAQEKAAALQARCEDLQHQLQRKAEYEKSLLQENLRLQESCKEENNQKRRLSQHNEELQWKLKQNKEIIVKVMEQAEESALNRSILSSSFNERHNNSSKYNLERTLSFRERSLSNKSTVSLEGSGSSRSRKSKTSLDFDIDDLSPPTSPKVKGVVEKSDSVSYVLEMDESPDVVASRIVRRSFRNTTPPKNTPTKSPSNKRPRIRNPLSLSASSSAIMVSNKDDMNRPRSASARNGDSSDSVFIWNSTPKHYEEEDYEDSCKSSGSMKIEDDHLDLDDDNEDDIQLPALPSEMDKGNTVLALPSPKHLAGEAMISESEDESTSSSQL